MFSYADKEVEEGEKRPTMILQSPSQAGSKPVTKCRFRVMKRPPAPDPPNEPAAILFT
jgi:hypothetical protein